jgi:carboxyl-terminal processing protease
MFSLLRPTDRGKLKLTIQQFYRVNGDSTQSRGVRSDLVLPSLLDHSDIGESFLDNALPFHTIPAARYVANSLVTPELLSSLQQQSAQRIAADPEFQKLQKAIDRYVERKSRTTVSLNEEELRRERDQNDLAAKSDDVEEKLLAELESPDPKKPVFGKNPYNDEVLNIALDYVQLLNGRVTVKR